MTAPSNFLTNELVTLCGNVAVERQLVNERAGRRDIHCADGIKSHFIGALFECAAAIAFNRYWKPVYYEDELHLLDVVPDLEGMGVRGTMHKTGRLILHPKDDDDLPYALVRADGNQYFYPGWVFGRDGKQQKYWWANAPSPAFFVDNDDLRDAQDLFDRLEPSKLGGWPATYELLRENFA